MRSMLMGRTSSFAHFAGFGRRVRADDAPPADDKDKDGKRSKAEDDPPADDDKDGKRSAAEDDPPADDNKDKDGKRSEDDPPAQYPDDDKDKDGKRSKASDDDENCEDDDQEEMTGKSAAAAARRRERARCAAIFGHPAAAENPQLACSLAFETTLTRQGALAVLKSQADRPSTRAEIGSGRAARNPDLGAGGGGSPTGKQGVKASWDAALGKVGIKPKG